MCQSVAHDVWLRRERLCLPWDQPSLSKSSVPIVLLYLYGTGLLLREILCEILFAHTPRTTLGHYLTNIYVLATRRLVSYVSFGILSRKALVLVMTSSRSVTPSGSVPGAGNVLRRLAMAFCALRRASSSSFSSSLLPLCSMLSANLRGAFLGGREEKVSDECVQTGDREPRQERGLLR